MHRLRQPVVALTSIALLVGASACGGDDDSSSESDSVTTAAPEAETTEPAAETTEPPGSATTLPDTGGGASAASPEDFLELCPAETAPDSLTFAIWGSHRDAVGEQMDLFTELTGVEIEWHIDGTPDRLIKLNAERGAPTIDLAIMPVNEIGTLLDNEVIEPKDPKVPNSDVLVEPAVDVAGGWGTSQIQFALAYNPDLVDDPPSTWTDLFDERFAGKVASSNVPGSGGYALLAMLAREAGGSEEDLAPAIELIGSVADDVVVFSDQQPEKNQLHATEEIWVSPGIAGTLLDFKEDGGNIEIVIPETGGPVGMNVGVIPAGNPDADCAKALLGWYLGPEVQTQYAEALHYTPVNTAVELPDDLVVFPDDPSKVVTLDWDAVQARSDEYLDLWQRAIGS